MTTIQIERGEIDSFEKSLENIEKHVPKYNTIQATLNYPNEKRDVRLARSAGGYRILVMRKRSRKYGHPITTANTWHNLLSVTIKDKVEIDPAEKWEKSWRKVEKMLEASGLWDNILGNVKTGLDVGYQKTQEAYAAYWKDYGGDNKENENLRRAAIREIDSRLVTDEGYINTDIIWFMYTPAKVKKMYFGKYYKHRLEEIANAFEKNEKINTWGDNGYDVSFEYNPELKKAWYSEEYKGCGNGHYYLALNATHALFYEDD